MMHSAPLVVRSAAALVIGGELLSGKVQDENSFALARTLRALGIELRQISIVPDDTICIAEELTRLLPLVDVVFTSGGVGPTHDDVTIDAVASALDLRVVEEPALLALLHGAYGTAMTPAHQRMARVPEGTHLIGGHDVRWPTLVIDKVWLLPGIPELFRMKLGTLRDHMRGPADYFSEVVFLRAEEADIKPQLDDVVARHPEVEIGSYPKWFDPTYKTRITFDARRAALAFAAATDLRERLADHVVDIPQ